MSKTSVFKSEFLTNDYVVPAFVFGRERQSFQLKHLHQTGALDWKGLAVLASALFVHLALLTICVIIINLPTCDQCRSVHRKKI
jgi:hypothetical protein